MCRKSSWDKHKLLGRPLPKTHPRSQNNKSSKFTDLKHFNSYVDLVQTIILTPLPKPRAVKHMSLNDIQVYLLQCLFTTNPTKSHKYGQSAPSKTGKPWTWSISCTVKIRWCFIENKLEFRINAGTRVAHGLRLGACVTFMMYGPISSRPCPPVSRHFLSWPTVRANMPRRRARTYKQD